MKIGIYTSPIVEEDISPSTTVQQTITHWTMAFKVFVFAAIVAAVHGGVVAPVAHVAVAANLADSEYDPHPQYSYAYDVQDTITGDFKSQFESRQGDVVQGRYSVVDPDGTKRVVDYTADPVHGFNAVVSRAPIVAPVVKVAAPVVHHAPIAARVVAPVHAHARVLAPAAVHAAPLVAHQHAAPLLAHQHAAPLLAHQHAAPLLAHQHAAPLLAHQHATPLLAHHHAAPLLAHQHAAPLVAHQYSSPLVHGPGVHSHSQFARFAAPLAYPGHAAPLVY